MKNTPQSASGEISGMARHRSHSAVGMLKNQMRASPFGVLQKTESLQNFDELPMLDNRQFRHEPEISFPNKF